MFIHFKIFNSKQNFMASVFAGKWNLKKSYTTKTYCLVLVNTEFLFQRIAESMDYCN